eukprot:57856-Prymnesium_polylepis.1
MNSELRSSNSGGARYKAESEMKHAQIRMLETNMNAQIVMLKEAAGHWREHSKDLAVRPKKTA